MITNKKTRLFSIFLLFILFSCASNKYSYEYFIDCEKKFSKFNDLSLCALKEIEIDCNNKENCKTKSNRFVKIIKQLQIMVESKEISENEAMIRYLKLIDFEESKLKSASKVYRSNYPYYFDNFYVRGMPNLIFLRD